MQSQREKGGSQHRQKDGSIFEKSQEDIKIDNNFLTMLDNTRSPQREESKKQKKVSKSKVALSQRVKREKERFDRIQKAYNTPSKSFNIEHNQSISDIGRVRKKRDGSIEERKSKN